MVRRYNKWILSYFGFPYPIALTMWHMFFSSCLAFICIKVGVLHFTTSATIIMFCSSFLPGLHLHQSGHVAFHHISLRVSMLVFKKEMQRCKLDPFNWLCRVLYLRK